MMDRCSGSIEDIFARAASNNIPLNILFELTYRCNLYCSHCYVVDRGERELSFSEIAYILDQLAAANCLFLTFTGGEVFSREDFLGIARYARSQGFALKMFSNGNLIDREIAFELGKLLPLGVVICLYGANAATHDGITGVPGSFQGSVNALSLLKARGVATEIKSLLSEEDIAQAADIQKLAGETGASFRFDPVIAPKNRDGSLKLQRGPVKANLYSPFSDVAGETGESGSGAGPALESGLCGAARDICCISPYGEVNACIALPISLGNLRENSFVEIWRGPSAVKLREFRFSNPRRCASCSDGNYGTRCRGLEPVGCLGLADRDPRFTRVRPQISGEINKAGGDL